MEVISTKFAELRDRLECAAFLVSKGGSERQVHSELVRALITLAETEKLCSVGRLDEGTSDKYAEEVSKVRNRLGLWARPDRQGQINARILNAFLRVENSGAQVITEDDLRRELPNVASFDSNFSQMKIIAEKNHGKIFEQNGSAIAIWEHVLPYVREYARATNLASLNHVQENNTIGIPPMSDR